MTDDREYPLKFRRVYFQLRAKDLERAKKFYEDVFNLEVTWYMSPEVGWCELRLPGTESRVGLNAIGKGEIANPNWGKLTLEVEDLEKAKSPLFFQVSRQVLVLTVSVTLNLSKRWIPQGLRAR